MSSADDALMEFVRGAFDLYEAGDFEALFELADPDIELHPAFLPGEYKGVTAVRDLFEKLGDPRDRWAASDLDFHVVRGMVVVTARLHAVAALGSTLNLPVAFLF